MKAQLEIRIWNDEDQPDTCDLPELFEPHVEHVSSLVAQGYTSGEIVDDKFNGWWTIVT